MARLRLRFIDGEVLDGESDDASSQRPGFIIRPREGNNELAWVPFSALKYCEVLNTALPWRRDERGEPRLQKLVLRFQDGEVVRAYKDEVFSHDGNCVNVMIWDPELRGLYRAIVPYAALKAIFFVKEWDSRGSADDMVARREEVHR